jgi:DNA-binding response OmpR family regulator
LKKQMIILAVDDDPDFLELLKAMLEMEEYKVITACNGSDALTSFSEREYSLVLLDIVLPDIDGCIVCKRIRKISNVPIIIVSAKASEEEKVVGLDSGANDYVTKPLQLKEFLARVRAASRFEALPRHDTDNSHFHCDGLQINYKEKTAAICGVNLGLTAIEYRLLAFLALNADRVVSSKEIFAEVWGHKNDHNDHLLKVNIGRLRQKLGDNKGLKYIQTRQGQGYIIKSTY